MKFVRVLKASEDWEVLRRHHDTANGEDYYYIWGPDGEYCDADGNPYHFDTREEALEEVEYLKAEYKGDEKSKKVKSSYGYDTFDEVLEVQITYLKRIKEEAERYLTLCEETMREIEAGNIENNLDDFSMKGQVESLEKLVDIDVELTNVFED